MDKKQWYLSMVDFQQKSIMDWRESAESAREMGNKSAAIRREAYAKEAEGDLLKLLDAADREGVEIEAPVVYVTRSKMREEVVKLQEENEELQRRVASYQTLLALRDQDREELRAEVEGLRVGVKARAAEAEDLYARLDRHRSVFGTLTFIGVFAVNAWLGMVVLAALGLATSSPMAFGAMIVAVSAGTIGGMVKLSDWVDR
jgi:hypothetical protein